MVLLKRIEVGERGGFVEALDAYGNDSTFYRVARICTGHGFHDEPSDEDALAAFINRLVWHKHMRTFEFAGIIIGIRCPIYVERQLRTYRKPDIERSLRMCEPIELCDGMSVHDEYDNERLNSMTRYQYRINTGARREDARRVLTLDCMTEVASYYTIRSLFHVFDERLHPAAQSETRKYVEAMREITGELFPLTMKAYENQRKDGERG